MRSIDHRINETINRYNLINVYKLLETENPNPGTFTHRLKQQRDIIEICSGNHLKVKDEARLINYINNYSETV